MTPEVTLRLTKVLLKYNLSITSLATKHRKTSVYISSRREIAYLLCKEYNYSRKGISEVLHCQLPMVTYLIKNYCSLHKLPIPKYSPPKHPVTSVKEFVLRRLWENEKHLEDVLRYLYWTGYRAGHKKARDVHLAQGVPRVASVKNNAPVSILEAPRAILIEVEDDQKPVTTAAFRGDKPK